MFTPQQPTFWLKVRKEYVIDNYDTLLPYLRGYHYAQDESPESDFNKTYDCLKEVVGDISQSMADDNVYNYTAPQWSVGLCLAPYLALRAARVFRTMAATMHRAPVIRLGVMVSPSRSTPRTMEVRGWRG